MYIWLTSVQVAEIEAEAFEFDIPMGDRTAREAQGQVILQLAKHSQSVLCVLDFISVKSCRWVVVILLSIRSPGFSKHSLFI